MTGAADLTLIVIAKEPLPGRCKTRLCPPLPPGGGRRARRGGARRHARDRRRDPGAPAAAGARWPARVVAAARVRGGRTGRRSARCEARRQPSTRPPGRRCWSVWTLPSSRCRPADGDGGQALCDGGARRRARPGPRRWRPGDRPAPGAPRGLRRGANELARHGRGRQRRRLACPRAVHGRQVEPLRDVDTIADAEAVAALCPGCRDSPPRSGRFDGRPRSDRARLRIAAGRGPRSAAAATARSSRRWCSWRSRRRSSSAPPGETFRVGAEPEGLVVGAWDGLAAVVTRDPSRLTLVDLDRRRVLERGPLPATGRHRTGRGPGRSALVPVEQSDELIDVGLASGRRLERPSRSATTPTTRPPAAGRHFVGNEFADHGLRGRGRRGGRDPAGPAARGEPGGVPAAAGGPGRRGRGRRAGARGLRRPHAPDRRWAARVRATGRPTSVAAGDPRAWVADTDGRGRTRLPRHRRPARRRSSPPPRWRSALPTGSPSMPERDRLWVTLTACNEAVEYDLSGARPRELGRDPDPATAEQHRRRSPRRHRGDRRARGRPPAADRGPAGR